MIDAPGLRGSEEDENPWIDRRVSELTSRFPFYGEERAEKMARDELNQMRGY